jgi:hypothetical protein
LFWVIYVLFIKYQKKLECEKLCDELISEYEEESKKIPTEEFFESISTFVEGVSVCVEMYIYMYMNIYIIPD